MAKRPGTTPKDEARIQKALDWVRRKIPPGFRLGIGIVLIVCGLLGFLPVLGFWMIPLGIAVAALDIDLIRDWWRRIRHKD